MFLVHTRSTRHVEHFSCLTRRNPKVRNSGIEERRFKRKKIKNKNQLTSLLSGRTLGFEQLDPLFFFYLIESGTHMSHFALLDPFQSQNNLFRPRFSFIYLKWKFFNYLTLFGIFFKIFVLWGPLDAYHLEFRENRTVLEFNEI